MNKGGSGKKVTVLNVKELKNEADIAANFTNYINRLIEERLPNAIAQALKADDYKGEPGEVDITDINIAVNKYLDLNKEHFTPEIDYPRLLGEVANKIDYDKIVKQAIKLIEPEKVDYIKVEQELKSMFLVWRDEKDLLIKNNVDRFDKLNEGKLSKFCKETFKNFEDLYKKTLDTWTSKIKNLETKHEERLNYIRDIKSTELKLVIENIEKEFRRNIDQNKTRIDTVIDMIPDAKSLKGAPGKNSPLCDTLAIEVIDKQVNGLAVQDIFNGKIVNENLKPITVELRLRGQDNKRNLHLFAHKECDFIFKDGEYKLVGKGEDKLRSNSANLAKGLAINLNGQDLRISAVGVDNGHMEYEGTVLVHGGGING